MDGRLWAWTVFAVVWGREASRETGSSRPSVPSPVSSAVELLWQPPLAVPGNCL